MKWLLIILTIIPTIAFGQFDPKTEEYQHKNIIKNNDTIRYHYYAKGSLLDKKKILLFFQGSGPFPLFSQETILDTIKVVENGETKNKIQKSMMLGSSVPFDLDRIPSDYIFVIISKKGVPFKDTNKQFVPNENYYANEGLDYRVWQGDEVIKDITKTIIKKPNKIVVIGHSEGSTVVAKLGQINKKVTHIGYWAGGANTQYYDFALMVQKKVQQGEIKQEEAINQLDSLFLAVKSIQKEPNDINKEWWGNSYRRWSQFTLPSIDNLLKIKKPIYVAVGTLDENVPFEASLLIPIEFARYNKTNLTFKMYEGFNHGFYKKPEKEGEFWSSEFMTVFEEFIKWVEQ